MTAFSQEKLTSLLDIFICKAVFKKHATVHSARNIAKTLDEYRDEYFANKTQSMTIEHSFRKLDPMHVKLVN